ncbi:nucleoside-diphosphate sugar epimerase [Blastococcus sp. CT_GayMR19]|uniref:SDR family oxidoreductase n=1 Tax=Blastococcus sp. CT_GayMR19 TaxID=2559608 RepID=UPI0010746968|nr:NmrA family NAD(P)-binding protein [Blastococcus sp. CT_GayMR19]TFV72976.1 nucleoside-diphosphate sugar epimerase [Blastococcus sp. CT_GayMR19]
MIVVTAAGGQTGAAVVRALWSRGHRVRAVVTGSRDRPELTALAADVVAADLRDPVSVEVALAGAEALYLIWPNFDPDEAAGVTALLAAARQAGIGRFVYHSVLRPQARSMPHHAAKDRVEEALDASGLAWRVLQPCAYADNLDGQLADVASGGLFRSPWGLTAAQSLVDLRDVADAAVVLLTEDGLDGGTFEAVGPERLTAPRIAELLAGRLGRAVTAVDAEPGGPVPPASDYPAHCRRVMFDHYRAHGFTGSPRVLEALLGRPTRTFAEHLASVPVPDAEEGT